MSIFEMLAQQPQEQAFCGITIGIVTDIKDPDKKNRVKVRLLNRSDSTQETDFIRVMTPMSGKQYGMFFLPEVGDEVLVGFVDGDFSDPYVLGSLWNTKAPAPVTVQDGKNELRTVKSKTAHQLEFNDGEEKPGVTLTTAQESRLAMDDKEKNHHRHRQGGRELSENRHQRGDCDTGGQDQAGAQVRRRIHRAGRQRRRHQHQNLRQHNH